MAYLSEADTCRKYVLPKLYASEWNDDQISEQKSFTDGRIVVATHDEAGSLIMSVGDDGSGIPADLRPRVFDPFFTRREGGIGLGLTIVQQIVQVHHGEIWVTESRWGGACFNIRFELDSKMDRG